MATVTGLTAARIQELIAEGDDALEAAITAALAGKAASAHTHDDRYYTEAEVDALLASAGGGAASVLRFTKYVADQSTKGTGTTYVWSDGISRRLDFTLPDVAHLVRIFCRFQTMNPPASGAVNPRIDGNPIVPYGLAEAGAQSAASSASPFCVDASQAGGFRSCWGNVLTGDVNAIRGIPFELMLPAGAHYLDWTASHTSQYIQDLAVEIVAIPYVAG